MLKPGQPLLNSADFDNAMFFGVPITVWIDDELIDYGGPIDRHTHAAVFINAGYFLKSECTFKVR